MVSVRPARIDDIAAITGIYNAAVVDGFATFDERPASLEDRTTWFRRFSTSGRHRLLVATDDEHLLGYAGSTRYRDHPAFDETVELTIYLDAAARGRGVGSRLYETLFEVLAHEPVHCVVAGIALPNDASVALHRRFGLTDVGVFVQYARKHGTRIDSLWMQRLLDGR